MWLLWKLLETIRRSQTIVLDTEGKLMRCARYGNFLGCARRGKAYIDQIEPILIISSDRIY